MDRTFLKRVPAQINNHREYFSRRISSLAKISCSRIQYVANETKNSSQKNGTVRIINAKLYLRALGVPFIVLTNVNSSGQMLCTM